MNKKGDFRETTTAVFMLFVLFMIVNAIWGEAIANFLKNLALMVIIIIVVGLILLAIWYFFFRDEGYSA